MQRDGVNAVIAVDQCDKPVLRAQHILRTFVVVQNVIGVDEVQCVKVVDAFILQLLNRCQLRFDRLGIQMDLRQRGAFNLIVHFLPPAQIQTHSEKVDRQHDRHKDRHDFQCQRKRRM